MNICNTYIINKKFVLAAGKSQNNEVIEQSLSVGFLVDGGAQGDQSLPELIRPEHLPAGLRCCSVSSKPSRVWEIVGNTC